MSALTIGLLGTGTISHSETDSVLFLGTGTLNIAGTALNPITVSLSSVAGIGLLDTINISYADVTLNGVAGVSALANYRIGTGGTLRLASSVGVSAGTTITFTGTNSHLVIGSGVNLSLLSGIAGFGLGSTIDLSSAGFASYTYADNAGTGTGGTLTLLDSNGVPTGSVRLSSGEFTAATFNVHADGSGGTLVDFATTVSSISATPPNGDLTIGGTVVLRLGMTAPVTVTVTGGTPTLTLNDGGTAIFDALNSTLTNLLFNYTVSASQNTADLTVTGSSLNGATIIDSAGNAVSLATAVGNPAGILQIDTLAPTITSVSTTPANGVLAAGQVVAFNLTPSEAVTVTGGPPTLTLNDGGIATYDAASSTATNLVFKYVVAPGDTTADLAVTSSSLNGATIADAAGNLGNLTGAIGNPPGILQINSALPQVISVYSVTTTPGSGDLGAGIPVALQVTLTAGVMVTGGTPTLTLSGGGSAVYDSGSSTPTSLIFRYVVLPGENTADLAVTAISLNGAVVIGTSGNVVDLSGAVTNPGGILQVDTTAPTISGVTTTPGNGDLNAGQIVAINVATNEAVFVNGGPPTLILNDGGVATYDAASSTAAKLVFKYTVQANENTADLTVAGFSLNGATVADGAGNALNLSASLVNPAGTLQIDTTAPTVTAVATVPGSGTVTAGQVVAINVTPSEAVMVSGGTPALTLNDGGVAIYDAANSTPTNLVFDYTVQAGQNTADLTITGSSLNGAAITDLAGNAIDLSGVVGNPSGTLQVDTVPVVTSVTVTPVNGDLTIGGSVVFQVRTSGPTTVTGGTPTLALSDGGTAVYDAASSTPTMLVFRNTVQAGQNTPDLAVSAALLNGAVISDGSGRTVSLAGAVGNPAGILQIDTIAPTALSVVMSGSLQPGQVVEITAYISEAVTVSGGPFMYELANGGIATYDASLSTPTMLVSTYRVPSSGPAVTADDVAIVGYNQNGASAADGAGNQLSVPSIQAAILAGQGNFSGGIGLVSPTTIDVYRFFDTTTGTHFYTQSQSERQTVLTTRPDLVPEGPNGVGLTAVNPASNDPNAAPVFRFFDLKQGTHFFTASTSERDSVIATRPDMVYEPASTFYEHITQQAGDTAVYRFFDSKFGTHFYTDDATERGVILQTRPDLIAEGVGFYEPLRNPAV